VNRTTGFITECERQHDDTDIILVSHGDTLAMIATAFARIYPGRHHSSSSEGGVPYWSNAEVRALTLASLPTLSNR